MMPVVAQMMYGSDVLILVHMYPSLFLFHLPSLYFGVGVVDFLLTDLMGWGCGSVVEHQTPDWKVACWIPSRRIFFSGVCFLC